MRFASVCLVGLLAAFMGCDVFSTRDPKKPTTGSSTFIPPTSFDLVLTNLQNAITERNTENYLRCFVDTLSSNRSFQFIPTASAAGRYATVFSAWSLQSERSYFSSLAALTPTSAASSLFLSGGFSIVSSDSAVYNGDYQLTFPHGIAGVSESFRGNVQFVLATDRNSFWSIVRWIDNTTGSEVAWSELKGRFAN